MSDYDQINLIGVELEGRWTEMPPEGELDYDGSVEFDGRTGTGSLGNPIDPEGPLIGEAVSDPMRPSDAPEWMNANYPHAVNDTCGLHVHLSFEPPNYQLLMDDEFYNYFMNSIREWGDGKDLPPRFWARLDGQNSTCRDEFVPDRQMHSGHGSRYCIWNFHAYRSHGTAECRVLPMFDSISNAQEAVMELCSIVNSFLDGRSPEPVVFSVQPEPVTTTTEEL